MLKINLRAELEVLNKTFLSLEVGTELLKEQFEDKYFALNFRRVI
ncbi:MAG: Transposase [Candidatus Midichloria mitochondrii]|uniref:Uncharacterized protein n=1 Tax=Midichloria mitochondrii (strain IricVA) TaxID=696127 RepID=F7XV61_MIDMI|nr:hypothetical protein [Candidatus Midichloria mitochondrii]AEI88560.1 hypothetical protein midi_00244 [Candidatus Midichloria mitochondrii IricVA]